MKETYDVQFATLFLEREAHDWWYHGLVMLGHENITYYVDFMQRLIGRFDFKNLEELEQLKQTRLHEEFIVEFERIAVMVTNISKDRLVMLFTETLSKPLQGWVKAFNSTILQDAIKKTQDMGGATPKVKAPPMPLVIPRDKGKKISLDNEIKKDLVR